MKGQAVDISSMISIGNQLIGVVPKLMMVAYFICLVALLARLAGRQFLVKNVGTTELAAICIAFGLAMR